MFVLVAGRRQGKTHAIVSWYLERPYYRYILTGDTHRKRHLVDMIGKRTRYTLDFDQVRRNVLTVEDIGGGFGLRQHALRGIGPLAIDDAEYVLERLLNCPVEFLSINATLIAQAAGSQDFIDGEEVPHWEEVKAIGTLEPYKFPTRAIKNNPQA